MTAAAPLPSPADAFTWLPEHMRPAARRWGFGLREGATWGALHVIDRLWYTDGACAVDSGTPAPPLPPGREPPAESWRVTGCVCARVVDVAEVVDDGATVLIGDAPAVAMPARIDASYHRLVAELWPGASWGYGLTWWGAKLARYAVATTSTRGSRRPVAFALPVSR